MNDCKIYKKYTYSNLNEPLENYLSNTTHLSHLTFSHYFDKPLENSLSNLTNLTWLELGHKFNQPLELPSGIKILSIDCNNLSLIENLPNNVEELFLGENFNLELNNLPNSIKIIKFDCNSEYNKELNNLPKFLKLLELPKNYLIPINNINSRCKITYSKQQKFN